MTIVRLLHTGVHRNMSGSGHETSRDIAFQVPYVLRLRFATDVLRRDERVLLDCWSHPGDSPPRVQFWLDENVSRASPDLVSRIDAFCRRHAARIAAGGRDPVGAGRRSDQERHSCVWSAC